MATGTRWVSAGYQNDPEQFFSGEVDYLTLSWIGRFSAEGVSASGVTGFFVWYLPAGFTAFASGTANGASAVWAKISATGAVTTALKRASAQATTTSGKSLIEWFDIAIHTGNVT